MQNTGVSKRRKRMAEKRRKYIAVGLLLLLTAGLSLGCGKGKETARSGETTELFEGVYTMSPAGVLRVNGRGYLQFFDRESDQTVYLCNQAGCNHRDADCSAYAENLQNAFYANDELYLIQFYGADRSQVMKANRYGENRQILGEMDVSPLTYTMRIYEDMLYFIGTKWQYEADNSTHTEGLYTFQLKDGTLEALPSVDTGYLISNVSDFYVTDRYIYTQYTASDTDLNDYFDSATGEFKEIEWDSIVYAYLLYRTDRQTRETELLIKEEGGDEVMLTILEAEGESFTIRLRDSILRYEGKELAEVLYTYSGDAMSWEVKPLTDGYLIWELYFEDTGEKTVEQLTNGYVVYEGRMEYRFRILENFTETGSFTDPEGNVNYYYGAVGDTLYFGGDATLYYMELEDFKEGNYEFHFIDID